MGSINLKTPEFLNLSETEQKKIIEDVAKNDWPVQQKQAAIESMSLLIDLQKKLKTNTNITMKQIRALLDAHAEKLKKLLLTQ